MSTTLNTALKPSFTNIVDTFKEAGTKFKKDGASLRLSGENLHTKSSKPSGWGTTAARQRMTKRENASKFVSKALDEHLEKAGLGKNKGSDLISNLRLAGLISKDRVTIKDLKTLNKYAAHAIKNEVREKVSQFDSNASKESLTQAVNKSRNEMESFKEAGLNGLVGGTRWEMSDNGVGGAILVTGENDAKSVLKFEGDNVEVGKKSYQVLNALRLGSDEPLPFVVPNMAVIRLDPESNLRNEVNQKITQEINLLKEQIETAKNEQKGEVEIKRLESKLHRMEGKGHIQGIVKKLNQNPEVIKLEMIENSKQINLLDVKDKMALLQSKQLGQNIGKSMVIMQFLGFNDHLNIGPPGATNFSNLMMNSEGHIHLIDPSMALGGGKVGLPTPNLLAKMLDVLSLLAKCGSEKDAMNAIKELFVTDNEGRYKGTLFDGEGNPLGNLMDNVFGEPFDGGSLFFKQRGNEEGLRDESGALASLSNSTKLLFVANVVKGLLEGVQYLDRNRNGIGTQIENTGVANYDSEQVLNEMHKALLQIGENNLGEIENALGRLVSTLQEEVH